MCYHSKFSRFRSNRLGVGRSQNFFGNAGTRPLGRGRACPRRNTQLPQMFHSTKIRLSKSKRLGAVPNNFGEAEDPLPRDEIVADTLEIRSCPTCIKLRSKTKFCRFTLCVKPFWRNYGSARIFWRSFCHWHRLVLHGAFPSSRLTEYKWRCTHWRCRRMPSRRLWLFHPQNMWLHVLGPC